MPLLKRALPVNVWPAVHAGANEAKKQTIQDT